MLRDSPVSKLVIVYKSHTISVACRKYLIELNFKITLYSKTCDHIFDDKLNQNWPFATIFGTLIPAIDSFFYFPTSPFNIPTLPWESVES